MRWRLTSRRVRPPDAYKGKGIRYAGEQIRLKPGKGGGEEVVSWQG